jgi:hypothetical protein
MDVMRMLVIVAAVLAIGGVAVAATNRSPSRVTGTQVSSLALYEKVPMAGINRKVRLSHGAAFQRLAKMIPVPLPAAHKAGGMLCGVCPLDVLTVTLSNGATRSYQRMTAPHAIVVVITQMRKLLPPPTDTHSGP